MAFVERTDRGWGIDRLVGLARAEPEMVWHAEAEWATEYLDGKIDASEYGNKISETMERTLALDSAEEGSDTDGNDTNDE